MRQIPLWVALPLVGCASSAGGSPDPATSLHAARVLAAGCPTSAYPSVQAAVDDASNGDVVEICGGVHTELVEIAGLTLTLRGTGASPTLDGGGVGTTLTVSHGADVRIEGLTVRGGSSFTDGGNIACIGSNLEITDSTIAGGYAAGDGGGLASDLCTGLISDATFSGNDANRGGGAWITGSLGFDGVTFVDNHAVGAGGGLGIDGDAEFVDSTFDGNVSDDIAGGAYVFGSTGVYARNTVVDNVSVDDGGGLYFERGAPTIVNSTFERNDSSDEGGGLRLKLSAATVNGNTFTANHADYRGGGVKASHEVATFRNNDFVENSTWVRGGGLFLEESASTVRGGVFEGNTAEEGGGLAIETGWDPVLVEDVSFLGNDASALGGGVFVDLPLVRVTLRRVELADGEADLGAGVYAIDSDLVVENSLLRGNVASETGGAIHAVGTSLVVRNSVAWQNTAVSGPAIALADMLSAELQSSVFAANTGDGALFLVSGDRPEVAWCDFYANTSNGVGVGRLIGSNGNIRANPRFRDAVGGNFHLRRGSTLVDAGDPSVTDRDGSRADIGLHGGPEAP